MKRTDPYRRQHERLMQLAGSITARLGKPEPGTAAAQLRTDLSTLAGVLKMHLAMEDEALYPALRESGDAVVEDLARAFAAEMGGLADAFTSYYDRWTARAIEKAPAAFARETSEVFKALARRIERENNELYPLLES